MSDTIPGRPVGTSVPPNSTFKVAEDKFDLPDVKALLEIHIAALNTMNQANNQMGHLLDLTGLQHSNITIFAARDAATNELMGVAALKEISSTHGELKSMRTADNHQRKGVAVALVKALMDAARVRGYQRLSLETGVQDEFAAAKALYTRSGFVVCEPYEGYVDDVPVEGSVFMTRYLT